jgi:hypothetical protein
MRLQPEESIFLHNNAVHLEDYMMTQPRQPVRMLTLQKSQNPIYTCYVTTKTELNIEKTGSFTSLFIFLRFTMPVMCIMHINEPLPNLQNTENIHQTKYGQHQQVKMAKQAESLDSVTAVKWGSGILL